MSSSTPPRLATKASTETLEDVVAKYRAFNVGLAERLGPDAPDTKRIDDVKLKPSYFIECSVCNKRGPAGETIFSGTMNGQRAGFTYDSSTLKAGTKVRWFCPLHGAKK